jgi:hypothetical protein
LADSVVKGGIGRFAGKSEIAEGRSDLRETAIRTDLLVDGRQRTGRSELLAALPPGFCDTATRWVLRVEQGF